MASRLYYFLLKVYSSLGYFITSRFTPAGQFVLAGIGASAALGIDTNRNVAYQVFTFLVALMAGSLVYNRSFKPRCSVRRILPKTGMVGLPLPYRLLIRNEGTQPLAGLELLERPADPRPSLAEFRSAVAADGVRNRLWIRRSWYRCWKTFTESNRMAVSSAHSLPPLPSGTELEVRLEVLPLRRGRLEFAAVIARRSDPFGLANGQSPIPLPQSLLILPRRYPLPEISLPGNRAYQRGGVTLANSVADSEEFQSLREYRPGDPPRLIHWKSWARAGKPVIKEFQDEFFVRHALVLDTFATAGQDALFEEAVSVAASFASTIQTQESLLDLVFVGTEAYCETAGRGQGQTERLLEVLACARPCREKPFSALRDFVLSRREAMSGCVCVLLAWDAERGDFIEQLTRSGVQPLVLVITDPGQANLTAFKSGEKPAWLHLLEVGKIAEGLARL